MDKRAQHPVDVLLEQIREEEGGAFLFDEAKIREEAFRNASARASLPVKLLTIFGGIMGSVLFLFFLLLVGLYNSSLAMLVGGLVFLAGSVAVVRLKADTMTETSCISFNIIGYILFSTGLSGMIQNDVALCLALALLALSVLLVAENMIMCFLAVLVLNGSLAGVILNFKVYNLMHGFIEVIALLLTYLSLQEAKFMHMGNWFNRTCRPVRMGLVFTLLAALILLVHQRFFSANISHFWISSIFVVAALLFFVARVLQQVAVTTRKAQFFIYSCVCLVLAPTVLTPTIAGAMLVIISSFYIGHRTSFVVGLLALIYFVVLYYYDLQLTLLVKSGVLVLSGFLFIGGYLLLQKHLKSYVE